LVRERYSAIQRQISEACRRVDRDASSVEIVAITKGRAVDAIKEAFDAGLIHIGESRVQETREKFSVLRPLVVGFRPIHWHLIGHLQTNKIRDAVELFDLIQSVDSVRLAEAIDKEAARQEKLQDILLEIKTSGETTKYGIFPDDAVKAYQAIAGLKHVRVLGLMTIAAIVPHAEDARPYFKALKLVFDTINLGTDRPLSILSMGMTDDFEVAVEEGSTMVRLGRALFE
jgi:PLP dependent protein